MYKASTPKVGVFCPFVTDPYSAHSFLSPVLPARFSMKLKIVGVSVVRLSSVLLVFKPFKGFASMADVHDRFAGTYTPHQGYRLGGFSLSLCSLTEGTSEKRLPKESAQTVEMATGLEVDEDQLEPRSDDDDT